MKNKPNESDPEWIDWFRKEMDEGGPGEEVFYASLLPQDLQDDGASRAETRARSRAETDRPYLMVNQNEACTLLNLDVNSAAVLRDLEANNRVLRFGREGYAAYPLFQFDVANRRVYPALVELLEMRTDDWGSRMALLQWLDRPNQSIGGERPSNRLAGDASAIINSFDAEIRQLRHGRS